MSDEPDIKIGISIDTSKLPQQVQMAEAQIKETVNSTTEALEAQGEAASAAAEKIETAARKAQQMQQTDARLMRQVTSQVASTGKKLVPAVGGNVQSMGKAVTESVQGMMQEANKSMEQVAAGAQSTGGQIQTAMTGASEATGGLTAALGLAKGAMDLLSKGFVIIGLFNQVVATIKMVMEWWQELQKEAVTAGQKVANQWKQAREEAANTARMRAPHESLQEQIELNEQLLAKMRERNTFEAEMSQMRAEREGNRRGVQRAILDGQLARGEITGREHLEAVRRLEDAEREEAQGQRMQELTTARDEAQTNYEARMAEHQTADENLTKWVRGAIEAGILNSDGEMRSEHWEKLATKWSDTNEIVTNYSGAHWFNNSYENVAERMAYERAFRERAALKNEILAGAQYMGIRTQKTDDAGKLIGLDFSEVAAEVMKKWEEKRAKLQEEVNKREEEEDAARVVAARAQARVDELQQTHKEEDKGVLQKRAQEDATLAYRAASTADKAEAAAEAARVELERREERDRISEGKTAEESELKAAQEMLVQALQMLKERASEEQKPAVSALEALMARSEQEPEVLEQLEALMTSGKLSITDDQSRRYGNHLRLVGNSGLDEQAVLGVLSLLSSVNQKQDNVRGYASRLEDIDRRDAVEAEEHRRQRVQDQAKSARSERQHAATEAAAAQRSREMSESAPLEGLDGALSAGAAAMTAQETMSAETVTAMGEFNSTAMALIDTATTQAVQIAALRQGQIGLKQQIANINRTNIC